MFNFFAPMRFKFQFCFVLLIVLFCISCQTDETALQNDMESKQIINKASQIFKNGKKPSNEEFEKIKAIYEKYPSSESAQQTYKSALILRDDFGALESVLTKNDPSKLSNEDKKSLAKVYVKLGKFQKALEVLKPLTEDNPNDVELKGLAGLSYFNTGEMDEAGKQLDSVWDELIKNKSFQEISIRGIIYYRQNDLPKAIETLEKALEINPRHISSNNTLSRIYAKKGDVGKAEEYSKKTTKAQEIIKNETFAKSKQVDKIYELEGAWKKKSYQEVINLSKEMLTNTTDKNQKSVLYQYLYKSYEALGMQREAQNILKQAQQLNQK